MTIELDIQSHENQVVWTLSGALTVFSLSEAKKAEKWIKRFPLEGQWLVSAEHVSTVDTAGLAFFIECVAHAKKNNLSLEFSLLPKALANLIAAQGVSELIGTHVHS